MALSGPLVDYARRDWAHIGVYVFRSGTLGDIAAGAIGLVRPGTDRCASESAHTFILDEILGERKYNHEFRAVSCRGCFDLPEHDQDLHLPLRSRYFSRVVLVLGQASCFPNSILCYISVFGVSGFVVFLANLTKKMGITNLERSFLRKGAIDGNLSPGNQG